MSNSHSPVVELTRALMARESVTPDDAGCQDLIESRLAKIGFRCERMRFGEVDNLWATRGEGSPTLAFAGHTDVVPPGPLQAWSSPPFEPTFRDGKLWGRGAADMKGSIAAMVVAAERFVNTHPASAGRLALLITSDEEGVAIDGTTRVVECLRERNETLEWCVVGEPTSSDRLGDTVRNGRRGSLNGELRVHGTQGHVAYPHLVDNPIHRAAAVLAELAAVSWDEGDGFFPPTSFQVSNFNAGTGADNVVPPYVDLRLNFRFSPQSTPATLQSRVEQLLQRHGTRFDASWRLSGMPFFTPPGELTEAVCASILQHAGVSAELSTGGGTSDGRFIATLGTQVVELGPINHSIHKIDEHVAVAELDALSDIFQDIMQRLLAA